MTIQIIVYPPGAPNQLYKEIFCNPRMRGEGNLAPGGVGKLVLLCTINIRPPPVAGWALRAHVVW